MAEDLPFRDQLRGELVAAASRPVAPRRNMAWRVASIAAAVIIGVLGVTIAVDLSAPDNADAGVLSVTRDGSITTVRLEDLKARPEQIEKELDRAGVNATVNEVPVADPVIGNLVAIAAAEGYQPVDTADGVYREFRVDQSGGQKKLELLLGRKAGAGENFAVNFNAYAPGGPLHCSRLFGSKMSDARAKIETLGMNVSYQEFSATQGVSTKSASEVQGDSVGAAFIPKAGSLIVQVNPPGATVVSKPNHVDDNC